MAAAGVNTKIPIQSTAGAIPMKNDKGETYMQKVKVARYVTGKRPDYAPNESDDSEEEVEFGLKHGGHHHHGHRVAPLPHVTTDTERTDRRLRRLQERHEEDDEEEEDRTERVERHRRLHEPEVLGNSDAESAEDEPERRIEEEDDEEEEELDEEEIERRRSLLRMRARQQREEEEVMDKEDEKSEGSEEEESSEYEEYTDSEEEETGPRLKPVFVRKKDRITIQEKEREAQRQKQLEQETKKAAEDRRRQTLKMVEQEVRQETERSRAAEEQFGDADTDDDNDEEEYEAWKVRELKRIKRDRDERESAEKVKLEIERMHNLTEEERRNELKLNPKQVTNKASKGKYKFLQKYYHRGAFYLDEEDTVLKRDFSAATLEDHFDKTILPKVMQVKNFGRSGRTKYTHLVDQDTTQFDSAWNDTALSHKFHNTKGGGMKQDFDRPSSKKKK